MIVCLLLYLLFCVDLREQNQFSWCLALDEVRPRYTIYLNDFVFFTNTLKMFDENWECDFFYREYEW